MLKIGTIYKTAKTPDFISQNIDGFPNYYFETNFNNSFSFAPRRGINTFAAVTGPDNISRTPVYIVQVSHTSNGTNYNPWHDEISSDNGFIKYYGDNKPDITDCNNSYLVEQFYINNNPNIQVRKNQSVPVICLEKTSAGFNRFQGFGIIESAELVTQYYEAFGDYIPNYLFTICIFSMADENEEFNWSWINDRCNPNLTIEQTLRNAPRSWKRWISEGMPKLHLIRRRVITGRIESDSNQRPSPNSHLEEVLNSIYSFYDNRKSDFEALSMEITRKVIEENGGKCTPGWLTPTSGDGGYDYVLRLDVGTSSLAKLQIIMLGQAKCELPSGHVSGKDIARLVARLKRGWVGAFVTTQTFSENTQKEILEDNYPLLLINGKKVAEIVDKEFRLSRFTTLDDYLQSVTELYTRKKLNPEDILE